MCLLNFGAQGNCSIGPESHLVQAIVHRTWDMACHISRVGTQLAECPLSPVLWAPVYYWPSSLGQAPPDCSATLNHSGHKLLSPPPRPFFSRF